MRDDWTGDLDPWVMQRAAREHYASARLGGSARMARRLLRCVTSASAPEPAWTPALAREAAAAIGSALDDARYRGDEEHEAGLLAWLGEIAGYCTAVRDSWDRAARAAMPAEAAA